MQWAILGDVTKSACGNLIAGGTADIPVPEADAVCGRDLEDGPLPLQAQVRAPLFVLEDFISKHSRSVNLVQGKLPHMTIFMKDIKVNVKQCH